MAKRSLKSTEIMGHGQSYASNRHTLLTGIRECGSTVLCRVGTWVPPSNTKFKLLLLPTQAGMPHTNTHKHRTSYFKSTLTFMDPKRCKSLSAARQKEILAILHRYNNNNN